MTNDCLCIINTIMMGDDNKSGASFSISHAQLLCPLNAVKFYKFLSMRRVLVSLGGNIDTR